MARLGASLILCLFVFGASLADPLLIQDDEITVFQDGAQVFVFANRGMVEMLKLAMERNQTRPKAISFGLGKELTKNGIHFYLYRLRPMDETIKCEKFAHRPESDDLYPIVMKRLSQLPCD